MSAPSDRLRQHLLDIAAGLPLEELQRRLLPHTEPAPPRVPALQQQAHKDRLRSRQHL